MLRIEVAVLREYTRKAARDQAGHDQQSNAARYFDGDQKPASAHGLPVDREPIGIRLQRGLRSSAQTPKRRKNAKAQGSKNRQSESEGKDRKAQVNFVQPGQNRGDSDK